MPGNERQRWLRYHAASGLAIVAAKASDPSTAREALTEAQACENPEWPAHRRRLGMEAAAVVAICGGDPTEAVRLQRRYVALLDLEGRPGGDSVNLIDAELAAGHAAEAVRLGLGLVDRLAGGRDEIGLCYARVMLAAALLALDEAGRARLHLAAGWPTSATYGIRTFYGDYLALLAALEGRPRAAARLAGYADARNSRTGPREPNEAAAIERARDLARAALGEALFGHLQAEGGALGDAEIAAIAFANTDLA
jgi:hypothetical protein